MKQAEEHRPLRPFFGEGEATIFTPWGERISVPPEDVQETLEKLAQVREQGPCLRCGHMACAFCLNWCDVLDADDPCPCDDRLECVYHE